MQPTSSEGDSARAAAYAIGREVRSEWVSGLATSRRASHVLILAGFLLLLGAVVTRAIAVLLTGFACLVGGMSLLIAYGLRLTWRAKRVGSTVTAHRKAQLAG